MVDHEEVNREETKVSLFCLYYVLIGIYYLFMLWSQQQNKPYSRMFYHLKYDINGWKRAGLMPILASMYEPMLTASVQLYYTLKLRE